MKTGIAKCLFGKWVVSFEEKCEKTNSKKDSILPIFNFEEKKLKDGDQIDFKIIKKSAHLL